MFQVQFISHTTPEIGYLEGIEMALKGGCRWIQLRMKGADNESLRLNSLAAKELCRAYGATFVIDDNVQIAKETGCDGVHLGKNDMPIAQAREYLGNGFIIGGTANTFEDILRIYREGGDYIGCGPFRYTTTKSNLSPLLGLEGYAAIVNKMREQGISVPLIAIGGITEADIPELTATGIDGIAVSGSVLNAHDPVAQMSRLVNYNSIK